jgi:hypothetical protein
MPAGVKLLVGTLWLSAVVALLVGALAWRRRGVPGALALGLLLLAIVHAKPGPLLSARDRFASAAILSLPGAGTLLSARQHSLWPPEQTECPRARQNKNDSSLF